MAREARNRPNKKERHERVQTDGVEREGMQGSHGPKIAMVWYRFHEQRLTGRREGKYSIDGSDEDDPPVSRHACQILAHILLCSVTGNGLG